MATFDNRMTKAMLLTEGRSLGLREKMPPSATVDAVIVGR
jgi:hypothetical protein